MKSYKVAISHLVFGIKAWTKDQKNWRLRYSFLRFNHKELWIRFGIQHDQLDRAIIVGIQIMLFQFFFAVAVDKPIKKWGMKV